MIDRLLDVLGNPHFEAWVAGGLTGALYANIFEAFKRGGPSARRPEESPQETSSRLVEQSTPPPKRQPDRQPREVHHHHYHGKPGTDNDAAGMFLIIGGVLLVVSTFAFAAYLPRIAEVLYFAITVVAAFSMFSAIFAAAGGRFTSPQWLLRGLLPGVLSLGAFAVAVTAEEAISPQVVTFAQELQANYPRTLGGYVGAAIQFYRSLNNEYVTWMLLIMLAFVLIVGCVFVCCMQCIHFIALANARDSDSFGWRTVVSWTRATSGVGWLLLTSALLVCAQLLASGTIYKWLP